MNLPYLAYLNAVPYSTLTVWCTHFDVASRVTNSAVLHLTGHFYCPLLLLLLF